MAQQNDFTNPGGATISGTPVDPLSPGGYLIDPAGGEIVPSGGADYVFRGDGAGGWTQGLHASIHKHGGTDEVATATPGANAIPKADAAGKLAAGWGGGASTLATLDASSKVVEDPANATATPTASKIPIAGGGGALDAGWIPDAGEAQEGVAEIATQVETDAGTDDARIVTPLKLGARALSGGDLGGSVAVPTVQKASGAFALTGVVTPATIGADQNDYSPAGLSGASRLRLSASAEYAITGIAGGATGRMLLLHNVGAGRIVLKHENAGSTAANRIVTCAQGDVYLNPGHTCQIVYDGTDSRWRIVGRQVKVVEAWRGAGGRNANSGDYATKEIAANGTGYFSTHIPNDFGRLVGLRLVGIPSAGTGASGKDIDLYVSYAAVGESKTTHQASDTTSTYDLTGKTDVLWDGIDLASLVGSLAAEDHIGVQIKHNAIGGSIHYLGWHILYVPRC